MDFGDRIKKHLDENKNAYVFGIVGVVIGAAVTYLIVRRVSVPTDVTAEGEPIKHLIVVTEAAERYMAEGNYAQFDVPGEPKKYAVMTSDLLRDLINKRWHDRLIPRQRNS